MRTARPRTTRNFPIVGITRMRGADNRIYYLAHNLDSGLLDVLNELFHYSIRSLSSQP